MAYSDQEQLDAVEKIVRSFVRFEYDALGTRRLGTQFGDVQDAAAGVFAAFPNAAFYVTRLGAERVRELALVEEQLLEEMILHVRSAGRHVSPVRKVSSLVNARVALDALSGAMSARAGTFTDISQVPAFQRFELNTQRFLDVDGRNVLSGGDIVPTPQEAREKLSSFAGQLREQHEELIRRVSLLAVGIEDYESLDLPSRLSRDIVLNASSVLKSHIEGLSELSPEKQLSMVRSVVLDVLAARAAVRGFGSLSPQGMFLELEGMGGPAIPVTPASLAADLVGPYAFYEGQDKLTLELEGDVIELQLPSSFVPFLQVITPGPFNIQAAANTFKIKLTGQSDVNVTLTTGAAQSVWDVVDDINGAIGAQPLEAVLDFVPVKTTQDVDLDTASAGDLDVVLPVAVGTWASLGVVVGDYILVKDATSSMDGDLFEITTFPDAQTAQCDIVRAGALSTETGKVVEVGRPTGLTWTVQVELASAQAALDNRWVLSLEDMEVDTLSNIGLFSGSSVTAQRTTAQDLALYINTSLTASFNGEARVSASTTFVSERTSFGRTNPTDPSVLVLYDFRGRGDITVGGTTATFSLPTLQAGVLAPGDVLVVREADTDASTGIIGTVTTVTGISVTVDFGLSSIGVQSDVLVEAGASLIDSEDKTIRIDEGSFQDGTYVVQSVGGLDLTLKRTVASIADLGGQPRFFEQVELGCYKVVLQSLDETLASKIEVVAGTDDASSELFSTVPKSAVGSTVFFQLPSRPRNLEAGDQLELHNTAVASPDVVRLISDVSDSGLVTLESSISCTQAQLTFTNSQPVPFGRVRKRVKQNYDEFKDAVGAWLELETNQLQHYFRQLDAKLNPIIVNDNPTPAQVNDAVFHLMGLLGTLTLAGAESAGEDPSLSIESALEAYEADIVEAVDDLIRSYEQKGADRAKDVLLECRFSDFFGLDKDTVSYAGHVQALTKEISREDLPVRKDTRLSREAIVQDTEIASWNDTDFEFTPEDADPMVDIPGDGGGTLNIPIP